MLVMLKCKQTNCRTDVIVAFCDACAKEQIWDLSRVESSPIQSSQTHKDAAETIWLTYNGRVRESVHTSRVESHESYIPVESSPTSRTFQRSQSHESCRVKSGCRMFHFRQSDSSVPAWRLRFCVRKWMQKCWIFGLGPPGPCTLWT